MNTDMQTVESAADVRNALSELATHGQELAAETKTIKEQYRTLRTAFKGSFAEKQENGVPIEEQQAYEPMDKYLGAVIAREAGKHTDIVNRTIDEMQEKVQTKALTGSPLVIDSTTGSFLIPEIPVTHSTNPGSIPWRTIFSKTVLALFLSTTTPSTIDVEGISRNGRSLGQRKIKVPGKSTVALIVEGHSYVCFERL